MKDGLALPSLTNDAVWCGHVPPRTLTSSSGLPVSCTTADNSSESETYVVVVVVGVGRLQLGDVPGWSLWCWANWTASKHVSATCRQEAAMLAAAYNCTGKYHHRDCRSAPEVPLLLLKLPKVAGKFELSPTS